MGWSALPLGVQIAAVFATVGILVVILGTRTKRGM